MPPLLPMLYLSLPYYAMIWNLLTPADAPKLTDIAALLYGIYAFIGLRGAAMVAISLGLSVVLAVLIAALPMRGRPSERHAIAA
jgi:hypothetical protein